MFFHFIPCLFQINTVHWLSDKMSSKIKRAVFTSVVNLFWKLDSAFRLENGLTIYCNIFELVVVTVYFLFVARISQLNSIFSAFIYVYEINCLLLSLPKLIALLTLGTIATAILKQAIPKLHAAYWILDAFPARIDSYFLHAISQCDFDDELFFYLKYDWVNGWWAAKCQLVYECIDDRDADAYNTNIHHKQCTAHKHMYKWWFW